MVERASHNALKSALTLVVNNAMFSPFCCHSAVALSPFPLAVVVSVHRCRCRMPWLVGVDDWLQASYGTTATEQIELDQLFQRKNGYGIFLAVCGCNGTEFSCVIFTEQRNFATAEWRNGNGRNGNGMVKTKTLC